jgi:hypothetical protein
VWTQSLRRRQGHARLFDRSGGAPRALLHKVQTAVGRKRGPLLGHSHRCRSGRPSAAVRNRRQEGRHRNAALYRYRHFCRHRHCHQTGENWRLYSDACDEMRLQRFILARKYETAKSLLDAIDAIEKKAHDRLQQNMVSDIAAAKKAVKAATESKVE